MDQLTFVTGNVNKLREAEAILGITLKQADLDVPEIQGSVEEVAKAKVQHAVDKLGKPCFVEDTGLGFVALTGLPGPFIKFFLQAIGADKLPRLLDSFLSKEAVVTCCIGYAEPGKEAVVVKGEVAGKIVEARGTENFGWDCIFQPDDHKKTYAEMTLEEKNAISHRRKALEKFKEFLEK